MNTVGAPYFAYPYFYMFPLFWQIFRFLNIKIRGTYYPLFLHAPYFDRLLGAEISK